MKKKKNIIENKERLQEEIKNLHLKLLTETKEKWNRDLPFEELVFDRWERAENLNFGEKTSIYHNSYIYGNVKVGKNTWIGPLTLLDGTGGLEIGDYCSISTGVQIYSHDSVKWSVSGGKTSIDHKPVKIGNCCFIGPNTVIKSGVKIGKNSVIGACSFVNRNIPPFSIAAGIPAKIIGKVILNKDKTVNFKYS